MLRNGWERFSTHDAVREVLLLLGHWVYLLPLLLVLLAVGGRIGRGFGLPHIFREDEQVFAPARCWRPLREAAPKPPGRLLGLLPLWLQRALASPALWSGFGFLATFGLFWISAHDGATRYCLREGAAAACPTRLFDPQGAPNGTLWLLAALVAATLVFLPLTWLELRRRLADFTTRSGAWQRAELARTALGCLAGAGFVLVIQQAAALGAAPWRPWVVATPYLLLLVRLFWRRSVLPCLSLFSLIIGLILIGMLFPPAAWAWKEVSVLAVLLLVTLINRGRTRYRLPGFEDLYDAPLNPQSKEDHAEDTPLIAPRAALDGWLARRAPTSAPTPAGMAASVREAVSPSASAPLLDPVSAAELTPALASPPVTAASSAAAPNEEPASEPTFAPPPAPATTEGTASEPASGVAPTGASASTPTPAPALTEAAASEPASAFTPTPIPAPALAGATGSEPGSASASAPSPTPAPPPKPILVLLATSGGAYRAGFWTSLLMDRLIAESGASGRWPGLAGDIRLITGASGGMVAGAYFVAMAAEGRLEEGITARISQDTWDRMNAPDGDGRRNPIARDSLSPVVHRLVTRDLGHLLAPWRPRNDRGRVLDRQWATLARSFAALHGAEAQGLAPSIILSPMLVETGAVALFSNLDLMELRRRALPKGAKAGDEDKASVEVFRTFPGTHEQVSMATAVRLNATFPYVSPAITLPTDPDRRPVDAGYYDNYGIDLLTAYLDQDSVHAWITEHCAGVAILQIRAFPSEPPTRPVGGAARALQFLTTPAEGIMSARRSSQVFRNDQQLAQARLRYNGARGRDFLKVFTFEANSDVSMSWYLRCDELRALERLLCPPMQADLVWKPAEIRARGLAPAGAGGVEVSRQQVEAWSLARYDHDYETFMAALQRREPQALWAQFVHHRAKIAATFDELAAFWESAAAGGPGGAGP